MAGAGNTRSPKLGVSRGGGRDLSLSHDVGQREPPRRREHPGHLCEPPALVCREVDHAVWNHGAVRAVVEWQFRDPRA
jgi:hypothetical protein